LLVSEITIPREPLVEAHMLASTWDVFPWDLGCAHLVPPGVGEGLAGPGDGFGTEGLGTGDAGCDSMRQGQQEKTATVRGQQEKVSMH
jgi:hypothetical protein